MTSRERLIEAVNRLNLPVGEYIVGGSGSMVLHGMDRELGDLDIFCTTRLWFRLMRQDDDAGMSDFYLVIPSDKTHERFDPPILRKWYDDLQYLKVDVFNAWKTRYGIPPLVLDEVFRDNRVEIDGIPTCDLDMIHKIKVPLSDPKHAADRQAIREFQMEHSELQRIAQDQRRAYPNLVPRLPLESIPIPR